MARIRCAIYTRKSTEEGLDQDFNSLDAQREACEAYIKSQAHEGWCLDPTRFDDGGFSGGNTERPALQRLLEAIRARQVDRIVVYKIDRLTRSLADFAKLVDELDAVAASFVSVTQSFNTATSMGRLTLNMLLSFAQFEREVTAERIRDKIAASKAKGLWMGGRIFDEDGVAMTRHTTKPRGKVYTYYLSGETSHHDWRIRASDIEGCVFWAARQIIARIRPSDIEGLASPSQITGFEAAKVELEKRSRAKTLDLVQAITLRNSDVEVRLSQATAEEALGYQLQSATSLKSRFDVELIKRKHELKLVYDAAITYPDPTLQQALLKAIHWKARLMAGETMTDIAKADGLSVQVTARRMRLAMLAPTMQMAIAKGTQPPSLTLQRIIESQLPLCWSAQESLLLEQGK